MNKKIKIIADDKIPFLKGVFEPFANVEYYPGNEITREKILDADALIIRTRTKCNADLLEGTNIKFIATATIGIDHIDTEYCNRNNIKWVNAPGCNSSSVMQYVTSALLTIAEKEKFNLKDKTIGIIGVGNVGSKVQSMAEIIGMNVLLNDPPRARKEGDDKFVDLETIINESDIITFHVPLIKEGEDKTYHLGSEDFFRKLKKKPVIINSSRGSVIETSAIKNAIKNDDVKNVIIDVWENEPNIDLELLHLVDFGTPHIAGYSADGKANGTAVSVNELNKFFQMNLHPNWYPENVPMPIEGNEINIDCNNLSEQKVLFGAVTKTYNITYDNKILRMSPETFEIQRGNYRIRREFDSFNLKLSSCSASIENKLLQLGFKIDH